MSWWSSKPSDEEDVSAFDTTGMDSASYDFSTPGEGSSLHSMSGAGSMSTNLQLEDAIVAEQEKMQVQQIVTKMSLLCFKKCINKPSDKLSSSETKCIANCSERYLDSTMFVAGRLMKQQQQQHGH